MKKNRKIISLAVAAVMLVATLGTVGAKDQKTYARNPLIQNSKYYMLEFSIESNVETAVLVLDGESHEMHREGENYVCRTSFEDGDHEYYFLLDETRFPERGCYRITEVERRWILLSSLIDYLRWEPTEEQRLGNKKLTRAQKRYLTQIIKSEAAASISGLTKRIAVTSPKVPQNFDVTQVVKSLATTDLGKGRTFDINKGKNLLDLSQNAYAFALESAKRAETLSAKCSHDISEKITAHDIKELARKFGYKTESTLNQEEVNGFSVVTLYTRGEIHPSHDLEWEGNHYYTEADGYWGHPDWWKWYIMEYDLDVSAWVETPYGGDGVVEVLGIWWGSVAGKVPFIPSYKGRNNVTALSVHREGSAIDYFGNFLTTVHTSASFDDETLSTVLELELDFEMGY